MKTLRLILSTFLLFIATIGLAQKKYSGNGEVVTTERTINDFNQLEVKGPFKVILTSALNNEIQLTTDANLMDQIITEVNDQTLSIRLKKHTYLNAEKPIHKGHTGACSSLCSRFGIQENLSGGLCLCIAILHSSSGRISVANSRNFTVVL